MAQLEISHQPARILAWRGLAVWGPALVAAYFLIGPLAGLIVGAFRTTPFGVSEWTVAGFATAFADPATVGAVGTSLLYAGAVTVLTMVIGVYFAVAATRFDVRLRRWITPAMIALLVTPRLFFGLSWTMLGNPNSGLIAKGLDAIGAGFAAEWFNAMSWQGLVFVTALKGTAVVYILMLGAISRVDRSHEDAAVMSGVSRVRAFFGITVPLLTPALLATAMLALVEGLQAYDFPALLGKPVGIHPLSLQISDMLLQGARPNYAGATALSLVFVCCIALLLLLQGWLMRGKDFVTVSSAAQRVERSRPGRFGPLVSLSIVAFVVVGLVGPVVQVVMGSFQGYFGVYGTWSTGQYAAALADADTVDTLVNTLLIAVFGGLMTVAGAFVLAYTLQRRRGLLRAGARVGSWVPLAAPGIVLSVALLWTYLHTPGLASLYGTPWLLLIALMVAAVPIAVRALEGVVAQVGPELEESARMSGASPARAVLDVTLRLCGPALLVAWLLVGMFMSGILDVPMLLASPGSQTVATLTFALATNNGEYAQAAAVYCLFFLFLGSVLAGVVLLVSAARLVDRRRRRTNLSTTPSDKGVSHEVSQEAVDRGSGVGVRRGV